jgi:hypothetical protein
VAVGTPSRAIAEFPFVTAAIPAAATSIGVFAWRFPAIKTISAGGIVSKAECFLIYVIFVLQKS